MADATDITRGVVFENASPELALHIKRIIAHQMAECLVESRIDISDRSRVIQTLQRYNFGAEAIDACAPAAAKIADQWGRNITSPAAIASIQR